MNPEPEKGLPIGSSAIYWMSNIFSFFTEQFLVPDIIF